MKTTGHRLGGFDISAHIRWDRNAFSLVELLVVMSIIGLLAGLVVGVAPAAGGKMREARARTELAQIQAAIEEYKARYGFFPPDGLYRSGPYQGLARAAVNPLFYELSGMLVIDPSDNTKGRFRSLSDEEEVRWQDLEQYFGRDGIANSSTDRKRVLVRNFRPSQHREIFKPSDTLPDLEVLAAPVPWDPRLNSVAPLKDIAGADLSVNPWHYVSTNPTNNPAAYDLWCELPFFQKDRTSGQMKAYRRIIGNWKVSEPIPF